MRSLAYIVLLVLAVVVAAAPITPAAPEYQRRAEQMRSEGMAEVCFTFTPSMLLGVSCPYNTSTTLPSNFPFLLTSTKSNPGQF